MTLSRISLLLVLVLGLGAGAARGQLPCYIDDGLNTPGICCVPVSPTLPAFPAKVMMADGACFFNCAVEQTFPVQVILGAPIPIFCDLYAIPFSISGTVNTTTTFMVAKYQRTFQAANPLYSKQIWRFLINTDIQYTSIAAGSAPCPVPLTATMGLPVHFQGSLDYAQDCSSSAWDVSFNLTHLCGEFMHGPWSARPVSPNPNLGRVYAFAGPAPFNFAAPGPVIAGSVQGDAQRSTGADLAAFSWQCYSENPIGGGNLTTIFTGCACQDPPALGNRYAAQDLNFNYGCIGSSSYNYQSLPWAPVVPTGLTAFQLGTYAVPFGGYPWNQSVSVYFGVAASPDPCSNNFPFHIVNGVGTTGGDQMVMLDSAGQIVVTNAVVDLENSLVLRFSPLGMSPGFGALHLSTMTWGLNIL